MIETRLVEIHESLDMPSDSELRDSELRLLLKQLAALALSDHAAPEQDT
jgi:hypothetical protein